MINGKKVFLRSLELKDAARIHSIRKDFESQKLNAGFAFPISEVNEKYWIKELYRPQMRTRIDFAICLKRTKKMIGLISLKGLNGVSRNGKFGIFVDRRYQSKGYGRDSMMIFMEYLFGQIGLHRVYLEVLEDNKSAISLYKKLGLKIEGKMLEHHFQDGAFKNVILMAVRKNEFWKVLKKSKK